MIKRFVVKEEEAMLKVNTPKDRNRPAALTTSQSLGISNYPSDDDISKIAEMPMEEIRSGLAQMGASDIPIPSLSTLLNSREAHSTSETGQETDNWLNRDVNNIRESLSACLKRKTSVPLHLGFRLAVIAASILIAIDWSLFYSPKPIDVPAFSAQTNLDLPDLQEFALGASNNTLNLGEGIKSDSVEQKTTINAAGNQTSLQQSGRSRQRRGSGAETGRQLKEGSIGAIHPDEQDQPKSIAVFYLLKFTPDAKKPDDKQGTYVAERMEQAHSKPPNQNRENN